MASLPAACGFIRATGDFSPIDIASPVISPKLVKVIALSATGICNGPII